MRLDLKENIVSPFRDPSWPVKMLLCLLCLVLVIPAPAFLGYALALTRRTARGKVDGMPDWSRPLSLWWEGLKFALGLGSSLFLAFLVTTAIGSAGAIAYGDGSAASTGMGLALLFAAFGFWMVSCLTLVFLLPAIALRWAMTGEVSSFVNLWALTLDIQQSVPDYLMIALFPVVATLPLTVVGLIPGAGALVVLVCGLPLVVVVTLIVARLLGSFFLAYFDEGC